MSAELNTIPKTVLAEAFAQARVEFGVAIESDFAVSRVSAKGKITTRTELGVAMSGNRDEKAKFVAHVALKMWATSKFGLIAAEIRRVFPKIDAAVSAQNAAINQLIKSNPELSDKLRLINMEKPNKNDIGKMFDLASGLAGADKGEKAKLLAAGHAINAYELRVREIAQEMMALENKAAA